MRRISEMFNPVDDFSKARELAWLTRRIAAGTEDRCCSSLGWPLRAVCVCDRMCLSGATRLRARSAAAVVNR